MLGVLEDHVDRFVFENDLLERDYVLMGNLPVQLQGTYTPCQRGGTVDTMVQEGRRRTAISRMALWLMPV